MDQNHLGTFPLKLIIPTGVSMSYEYTGRVKFYGVGVGPRGDGSTNCMHGYHYSLDLCYVQVTLGRNTPISSDVDSIDPGKVTYR